MGNDQYSIDNYNSAVQFLDVVVSKNGKSADDNNDVLTNNSKRREISIREFADYAKSKRR